MAWENRGNNRYYYRKRRIGRRVVSEYIGAGLLAEMQAEQDVQGRERLLEEQRIRCVMRKQAERIDGDLNQAEQLTRALVRASLLLAGYHPHSRTWRKRRHD